MYDIPNETNHTNFTFVSSCIVFLGCKRGVIPFRFLGIMIGVNPRRKKVWEKIVNNVKSRLMSWLGKFIFIGARVTLIKAALNAIPVYTLSFYKAP